jgi:hypothetical protein
LSGLGDHPGDTNRDTAAQIANPVLHAF